MKRFYDYLLTSQTLRRARFLLPLLFLAALISFSVTISSVQSTAEAYRETQKVLPVVSATPTTAEVCRETQKVLEQLTGETWELSRTRHYKTNELGFRRALSALDNVIASGSLLNMDDLRTYSMYVDVELPKNRVTGENKPFGEMTVPERSALQRSIRNALYKELMLAINTTFERLDDQQAKIEYQRKLRWQRMADLNCAQVLKDGNTGETKGNDKWAGTYVNETGTMTVSGGGSYVSAQVTWKASDSSGTDSYSSCNVTGNTATNCQWSGKQEDIDKKTDRKGKCELTLNGDGITVKCIEDTPTFQVKKGREWSFESYVSKMRKGAEWTSSYTRKQ